MPELAQEVPEPAQEVPEQEQGEPAGGWPMTLLLKPREAELEVRVRPQALVRRCWEHSWQTIPPSASGPSLTE